MSEQNKVMVRRIFEEIWNRGNLTVIDENFASDYLGPFVGRDPRAGGCEKSRRSDAQRLPRLPIFG